jgi:hypothetical protein
MIPITQTKVVVRNSKDEVVVNGNCWAAAIASILELPLTEVPNFEIWFKEDTGFWWELTNRFLHISGYKLVYSPWFQAFHKTEEEWNDWIKQEEFESFGNYHQAREDFKDQYYFISGQSPRGVSHVTIWQNGKMVHDPHPTREGILELKSFEQIIPLTEEEKANVADKHNYYKIVFPSPSKVAV